jgi:DNA-directed RNA polymerase III subunit RPC6
MLEHIQPSVGLTGGPWYTESELDTVFIETISKACLKFIRDVVRLRASPLSLGLID